MTWTAQIATVSRLQTGIAVDVLLVHDTDKPFTQSFQTDGTLTSLRNQVRSCIAARDAAVAKTELSVNQAIDLSADPAPNPPSAADVAQAAFLADWRLYQALQRGVAAGLIDPADKTVGDLKTRLIAEFLPAYGSLL